jgi:5-methylcytosine-specific restriction endonuclease McrA
MQVPTTSKHFVPMLVKIRRNMTQQHAAEPEPAPHIAAAASAPRKKQKIPGKVRSVIWSTYIGAHIAEHRCICCKRATIKQSDFEVGHVLSEAHGGTLEINNLRPICSACNKSMGSRNMIEYVKQYGYYI